MNSTADDLYLLFRKIGSDGIVIFDRDEVLLKRRSFPRDVLLGDINQEIVEVLRNLREQSVIFGFISYEDEKSSDLNHLTEYATVVGVLDELLRVLGVAPDFWLARGSMTRESVLSCGGCDPISEPEVGMIIRAIDWYGVERDRAVFISANPATTLVARRANIEGIHYPPGWPDQDRQARSASAGKATLASDEWMGRHSWPRSTALSLGRRCVELTMTPRFEQCTARQGARRRAVARSPKSRIFEPTIMSSSNSHKRLSADNCRLSIPCRKMIFL